MNGNDTSGKAAAKSSVDIIQYKHRLLGSDQSCDQEFKVLRVGSRIKSLIKISKELLEISRN